MSEMVKRIKQLMGPYRARLEAIDYHPEKIPRRKGWWFTTNTRTRHRMVAANANVRLNTDSPIQNPDRPDRVNLTYRGRRVVDYTQNLEAHRDGREHFA